MAVSICAHFGPRADKGDRGAVKDMDPSSSTLSSCCQQVDVSLERVIEAISNTCRALLRAEQLTEYVTLVGERDSGTTFATETKAILSAFETRLAELSPDQLVHRLGEILEDNMEVGSSSVLELPPDPGAWGVAVLAGGL